jgi:hypothetical protein
MAFLKDARGLLDIDMDLGLGPKPCNARLFNALLRIRFAGNNYQKKPLRNELGH